MKPRIAILVLLITTLLCSTVACGGCQPSSDPDTTNEELDSTDGLDDQDADPPGDVRQDSADANEPVRAGSSCERPLTVATFNTSLFRDSQGALLSDLQNGVDQAEGVAEILEKLDADILLLNEFDFDEDGASLDLFNDTYLSATDIGSYPYVMAISSNTGIPSGLDLNQDGRTGEPVGTSLYAGDSWGFGEFPGQYGFVVLSRFPIQEGAVRTFQEFKWQDLPGNELPTDFYGEDIAAQLRLSSKNHADIPITVGDETVHFLVSHPTPPSFDGPEDRNGLRNLDEIRFWEAYISQPDAGWACDDDGTCKGLADDAYFVIAGDLNSDPNDGEATGTDGVRAAELLLSSDQTIRSPTPESEGGEEQAQLQAGSNMSHTGDPAQDTADFDDRNVGNLRADYALPSNEWTLCNASVYWPTSDSPDFSLIGTFPFPVSDHRPVTVNLAF